MTIGISIAIKGGGKSTVIGGALLTYGGMPTYGTHTYGS